MLTKNMIIDIEIDSMTSEGMGIGRYEGQAIFVADSAVGDVLSVKILKVEKRYAFAKIEKIIKESGHRKAVDCSLASVCGGCVYRHINYEEELRLKHIRVKDAITRIGKIYDAEYGEIAGALSPDRYRNKAQIPVRTDKNGNIVMGFFAARSHRVVNCPDCLLQPKEFSVIMSTFKSWMQSKKISAYNEDNHTGVVRHLFIRKGEASGDIMVCVVINGDRLCGESSLVKTLVSAVPSIKSIIINSNKQKTNVIMGKKCRTVFGNDTINDRLCGLDFKISPLSFYQVNRTQAEKLYETAAQFAQLTGKENILDLYCGTGTIGLSMAKCANRIVGVEIVEQAISDAKENATANDIKNADFFCADAEQAERILADMKLKMDVVIVDPPRKGCSSETLMSIDRLAPKRIVYVSCDPATLSRDLRILEDMGWKTKRIKPVDMFPRTAHVETVALLSR